MKHWKIIFILLAILLTLFLGSCGSTEYSIVGRWSMVNSSEIWEFFEDGTVSISGSDIPLVGNYEFVNDDHIRLEFGGLGALTGAQVFAVEISQNELHLNSDSFGNTNFIRIENEVSTNAKATDYDAANNITELSEDSIAPESNEDVTAWKLLAYDLESAPGDPGWTEYKARIGYQVNNPMVISSIPIPTGYVTTEDGNQYDAVIESIRFDDRKLSTIAFNFGQDKSIDYDLDQLVGHVPGVVITSEMDSSKGLASGEIAFGWLLSFRIPETLTPASIHISGFPPIDFEQIQSERPQIKDGYEPNYVLNTPIQATDFISIKVSNPRTVPNDGIIGDLLTFNISLQNTDSTSDQEVAFGLSMVDNNGLLHHGTMHGCDEGSELYFNIDTPTEIVGPGQTKEGFACFMPFDQQLSTGPFIITISTGDNYNNPNPDVYTFELDKMP